MSETGYDLKAKYPTVKQFVSWLNLVPDTKISGGKVLSQKMRKRKNKAGQAFRQAASTLWRSKNPLEDKLRSKKAKKGAGPAIVGIAKTLADLISFSMNEWFCKCRNGLTNCHTNKGTEISNSA